MSAALTLNIYVVYYPLLRRLNFSLPRCAGLRGSRRDASLPPPKMDEKTSDVPRALPFFCLGSTTSSAPASASSMTASVLVLPLAGAAAAAAAVTLGLALARPGWLQPRPPPQQGRQVPQRCRLVGRRRRRRGCRRANTFAAGDCVGTLCRRRRCALHALPRALHGARRNRLLRHRAVFFFLGAGTSGMGSGASMGASTSISEVAAALDPGFWRRA